MNLPKQNIVIVTSEFPPQPGGIGNHAYNLALYLYENDYNVEVIADQRSRKGHDESKFDALLGFKITRVKHYNMRFIMYLKRIQLTLKSLKKTPCVIATGKFSLWNVAFCSLFYKRNTIAVAHGSEVNFKSLILRKSINISLKQFNTIVAVSNYTKGLVSHLKKDIIVIPNGINNALWNETNRNDINLEEIKGNPVLTTVGRVSTRKGQLNVIKHLRELLKYYPELHYHCIGIPSEAEAFIKVAQDLNVHKHISFHGKLDDSSLKNILRRTDVFVMLSNESLTGDVEGFGIAILEANAMGVPAIGAKKCGIEDAIHQGVSGILVDVNSIEEFKLALDKILNSQIDFKNGAQKWASMHDWEQIVKHYMALIN